MSQPERGAETTAGQAAHAEHRARALATPRDLDAELNYLGAGELLLRLAYQPSFEPSVAWEIRRLPERLVAYVSRGHDAGSRLVVGHEPIAVDDAALRGVLDQLSNATVPLTPSLTGSAVVDGAEYFATISIGLRNGLRLAWSEDHAPESWTAAIRALVAVRRLLEAPGSFVMDANPTPLLVESLASTVKLVRLTSGEFQVWDPGEFGSLICGPDFILAIDALADALCAACGPDIDARPVSIFRRASGERWTAYKELFPAGTLGGPDDLPHARQSTRAAWRYSGGHLFVTSRVQAALNALGFSDLTFSKGFSQFAGARDY